MGNPWGVVSRAYAWGCNTSGQLGLDHADKDYRLDQARCYHLDRRWPFLTVTDLLCLCSVPQRVLLPEYEIITSLAAGKVTTDCL